MDRKKLALALLAGEDADLSVDGVCKLMFRESVPENVCYAIIRGDAKTADRMKAMVAAGYAARAVLQLVYDDNSTFWEDIIPGCAAIGISLEDMLIFIKEKESAVDDNIIGAIMSSYDITGNEEILGIVKQSCSDLDSLDDSLRDRDIPIEKRIRILAKVLGII